MESEAKDGETACTVQLNVGERTIAMETCCSKRGSSAARGFIAPGREEAI